MPTRSSVAASQRRSTFLNATGIGASARPGGLASSGARLGSVAQQSAFRILAQALGTSTALDRQAPGPVVALQPSLTEAGLTARERAQIGRRSEGGPARAHLEGGIAMLRSERLLPHHSRRYRRRGGGLERSALRAHREQGGTVPAALRLVGLRARRSDLCRARSAPGTGISVTEQGARGHHRHRRRPRP